MDLGVHLALMEFGDEGLSLGRLRREPGELADQVCVGPPERCARLLSRFAEAGCERVHFWPLGDEPRQIGRIAFDVAPMIAS